MVPWRVLRFCYVLCHRCESLGKCLNIGVVGLQAVVGLGVDGQALGQLAADVGLTFLVRHLGQQGAYMARMGGTLQQAGQRDIEVDAHAVGVDPRHVVGMAGGAAAGGHHHVVAAVVCSTCCSSRRKAASS